MNSGIYKIVNTITSSMYIGSTKNFKQREQSHFSCLRNNKSGSVKLQCAVNKYGIENFKFEILAKCPECYLQKLEQFFINILKPKYNICENPYRPKNNLHTKEVREKMSRTRSCIYYQYDLNGNLLKEWVGKKSIQNGLGIKVKKHTDTNLTIGNYIWIKKGDALPNFDEIKERVKKKTKCKMVFQLDTDNNVIGVYYGVRQAYRETGIDHRSISQVAAGSEIRKTAGGYIWKYK